MAGNSPHFFPDEEKAGSKLSRKAKESPFMVVGKKIVESCKIFGKFREFSGNFQDQNVVKCVDSKKVGRKRQACHDEEYSHS